MRPIGITPALIALLLVPMRLAGAETSPRRPNIIFILADDLGYGDLGCYGQRDPHAEPRPHGGPGDPVHPVYAGSTVCAPSRCALMAGRHTGHARVRGNARVPLRPEDLTVAEVLQGAGYATGLDRQVGPGRARHDRRPRTGRASTSSSASSTSTTPTTTTPITSGGTRRRSPLGQRRGRDNIATQRVHYAPDLFTDEALEFIEQARDGPFFLYLAYTLPHANNERAGPRGTAWRCPTTPRTRTSPGPSRRGTTPR